MSEKKYIEERKLVLGKYYVDPLDVEKLTEKHPSLSQDLGALDSAIAAVPQNDSEYQYRIKEIKKSAAVGNLIDAEQRLDLLVEDMVIFRKLSLTNPDPKSPEYIGALSRCWVLNESFKNMV